MKNDPLKKVCIILSALSLALGAAFVIMTAENIRLRNNAGQISAAENAVGEIVSDETEESGTMVIMPEVSETTVTTEHICPVAETVYIYDNGIDLIEFPPVEGAALNDYDMESLSTLDKKRKALYGENGVKRSRFGIDVSSYQCDIDWERAAADDVEFAIIRLGYRGYETGQICEDRYFRRNIEGAAAAGLDVGVYFYSQAITADEAVSEAEYVIGALDELGIPIKMPVVFDWEFVTDEDPARTDGMTGDIQTECCRAFCDRIAEAGYSPMYYATVSTALFRYDMGGLPYPLWLAEYAEKTRFIYDYDMWQYSCSGVVDGIEGLVDLNIYIEK